MPFSLESTSSKDQESLALFWHISSAEVATPPALAALAGPNRMPAFWKAAMAPGVLGMLAPSATALTPLAMRMLASSSFSSFWVAQGRAMSQGMVQMPLPSVYLALGLRTAYSLILCPSAS